MYIFLTLLIYTWALYPAIIIGSSRLRKKTNTIGKSDLSTTVVIPVYNGELSIKQKIENCLELEHPQELNIVVVSDGSTDQTCDQVKSFKHPNIKLIQLPERMGKSFAQNAGVEASTSETILFTDVESILEKSALTDLLARISSDSNVACVGGRIAFRNPNIVQKLYWLYENKLRDAESKLGLLTSISGAAFLVRVDKFTKLDADTGDDMVIPLDLKLHHGMQTVFVDSVIASDQLAHIETDILNSRRRITRRNLLVIARRKRLLNIFKSPATSLSILSHKLLRWFTPFCLIGLFVTGIIEVYRFTGPSTTIFLSALTLMAIYKSRSLRMEITGLLLGTIDFIRGARTTFY